jgi:hypothetical protein
VSPGSCEPEFARDSGPVRHQSPVYGPLEVVRQGEHTSHVCQPGGGPKAGREES